MYVCVCVRVYMPCNFWRIMFRSFFKRKMLHATDGRAAATFTATGCATATATNSSQSPFPFSFPFPVTATVSVPFPFPIPDPPLITKVRVRVKVCLKSNRLDMKLGAVPSRLAAAAAAAAIGPRDRPSSGSVGFIDISQMEHTKAVGKAK